LILATLLKKCLQWQQEMDSKYLDTITTTVKMILGDRWGEIGIPIIRFSKQFINIC